MSVTIIGKLENCGLNGEGNIHLTISKRSQDIADILIPVLKKFEGKEILVTVRLEVKKSVSVRRGRLPVQT